MGPSSRTRFLDSIVISALNFATKKFSMKKPEKRLIKHSPNTQIVGVVQRETTFLVKLRTPFVSAIKQITKILQKFDKLRLNHRKYNNGEYKRVRYITVKGAGRAIEKAIAVGAKFAEMDYKVDYLTGSVEVLDEFKGDDSDDDSEFAKRMVSYIEARIWLKRD